MRSVGAERRCYDSEAMENDNTEKAWFDKPAHRLFLDTYRDLHKEERTIARVASLLGFVIVNALVGPIASRLK